MGRIFFFHDLEGNNKFFFNKNLFIKLIFFFFFFFLSFVFLLLLLLFLGPLPWHMEVPRLGVESEL